MESPSALTTQRALFALPTSQLASLRVLHSGCKTAKLHKYLQAREL